KQPSVSQLKEALTAHGPLYVAVFSRTRAFHEYRGGVHREDLDHDRTSHAVLLVGWDDSRGGGAWRIKNCWGERWGEKGSMWIAYGSNNLGNHAAAVEAWPAGQPGREPLTLTPPGRAAAERPR